MRSDILFLACTRPAMVPGLNIPAVALGAVMIFCGEFFTISHYFLEGVERLATSAVITAACIVACRLLVAYDPNAFRLIYLGAVTRSKSLSNLSYWRGSSLSPAPVRRARTAAEIPYAV